METFFKKYKHYIIVLAIIIMALPFCLTIKSSLAAKPNSPKIVFEELNHDFGKVLQGTNLEYSYKFTNDGSGILVITYVRPSCGCTGAVLDGKKEFDEGETGEIKVTFNTQGREGIQVKTVNVTSNDSTQSDVVLTFRCDIYKNQ